MLELERDIYVRNTDLWLDPKVKKPFSFVSHGHSDHLRRHHKALVSERTALFYKDKFSADEVMVKSFNEPFSINGCLIELFPSGHMLGSSQILIEDSQRVVYTGDFKLEKGETAEQVQIKRCDILIMECTYGNPKYAFPSREKVNKNIIQFVEKCLNDDAVPVLFAYRMGKAQEVMKLLGDRNLPITVPKSVYEISKLYERAGVTFSPYKLFEGGDLRNTLLVGPWSMKRQGLLDGIRNKRTAALTGWAIDGEANFRFGADVSFPLSDHADFNGLLEYVRKAQPKKVYTVHGPRSFSKHLRNAGFETDPLPLKPSPQLSLW